MSLPFPRVKIRAVLVALSSALVVAPQISSATAAAAPSVHAAPVHATAHNSTSGSASGRILVANEGGNIALGFVSAFSETDNGNVAPISVIGGRNTGLASPLGVAIDPSGRIGVTLGTTPNSGANIAATFAAGAMGNVPPLAAISCFPRGQTSGAAFDSAGNFYVSRTFSTVDVFAPGANGCAAPLRVISGIGAYGITIGKDDVLYVADALAGAIDLFAPRSSTLEAQIGGTHTGLVEPVSIALDAARNIYVLDFRTETISEFAAGAHGNVSPIRRISGRMTGLNGAFGIAVSRLTGKIFASNPASNRILGFAANATGNSAPSQTITSDIHGLSSPWLITLQE